MPTTTNESTPPTDPATPPFPHISVENKLGAGLLGLAAVCLLNGVLFHQAYRYFREYGDDKRFLKIWVIIVVVLQTFIDALQLHAMWFYLVQLYWDPTSFFVEKVVWSLNVLPVAAATTALVSQTFFVRRLWLLADRLKIIAVVVFILNAANTGCFAALSVKMFGAANVAGVARFTLLSTIAASIQMAGDVILTLALIYVFRKSRTGIGRTDSMLEVMIAYAIGTGAVNGIGHLLTVAFSIAYPHNWIFAFIACIDAKLYGSGFLVALASRKFLAMSRFSDDDASGPRWLSAGNVGVQSASPRSGMRMSNAVITNPTAIELKVRVVTEEEIVEDDGETRSNLKPAGGGMV